MKGKKVIGFALLLFVLSLIVFCAADYIGRNNGEETLIVIENGEGLKSVTEKLKKSGAIAVSPLFELYAKKEGAELNIKPGEHTVTEKMGYKAAVREIVSDGNKYDVVRLTIPEGFEIYRVAERVYEVFGISEKDFYSAANKSYGLSFTENIPSRENRAEGYLFPDTYEFMRSASAEEIVEKLLNRFSEIWTDEMTARANEIGMTMDEVIILASVIEREAGNDAEMGKVSSVFHNRLKADMPLQSCATVQYILKERKSVLSVEDTKIDSPYNTYLYKGLPEGPIASPGKAAIEAALYPEDTPYYYFKVDLSGVTVFSETFEEHNAK